MDKCTSQHFKLLLAQESLQVSRLLSILKLPVLASDLATYYLLLCHFGQFRQRVTSHAGGQPAIASCTMRSPTFHPSTAAETMPPA